MPNRFRRAAPTFLLACLVFAAAAPAVAQVRETSAGNCWQQIVALFARWSDAEATQNCIPSEVDSCGVQEPQ